jgi:hypothetical protein
MKKLWILTAAVLLLSSAGGCRMWQCWQACWRGSWNPCPPTAVYAAPTAVVDPCNPCDPCATAPAIGPAITPGPGTYVPGMTPR